MLLSNLSLWFGFINTMVFIGTLAHNDYIPTTKLHMGILQGIQVNDSQYIRKFYCSYALSALRHLQLTEEFLYNSNKEFMYIPNYDLILFDAEAASMLASVQCVPSSYLIKDILWTLWFYTDKVRMLLYASSKGEVFDSLKTQFMFKVHQFIKQSLQEFLRSKIMEKMKDVQKKLDELYEDEEEEISNINDRMASISKNKELLNSQMTFNEKYGVSTDGKKHISFLSLSNFDKLDKMKSIVVEYFGELYWTYVKNAMCEIYITATKPDIKISHQVKYLWHIKNGIMKILKLILIKFIESYLDFMSNTTNITTSLDKFIFELSKFCECVGSFPENDRFVFMFKEGYYSPDFYNEVKSYIIRAKKFYPSVTKIEDISDYYLLLIDERNMIISEKTQEWENIRSFLEKVKDFFFYDNMIIAKSFEHYPILTNSFKTMEKIEHPTR